MIVRARYAKNMSIVSKLDELYRFSDIYSNHANSTFRNCSLTLSILILNKIVRDIFFRVNITLL